MLTVCRDYKKAINKLTSDLDFNMRKYELSKKEWDIVDDLVSVLKVSLLVHKHRR